MVKTANSEVKSWVQMLALKLSNCGILDKFLVTIFHVYFSFLMERTLVVSLTKIKVKCSHIENSQQMLLPLNGFRIEKKGYLELTFFKKKTS